MSYRSSGREVSFEGPETPPRPPWGSPVFMRMRIRSTSLISKSKPTILNWRECTFEQQPRSSVNLQTPTDLRSTFSLKVARVSCAMPAWPVLPLHRRGRGPAPYRCLSIPSLRCRHPTATEWGSPHLASVLHPFPIKHLDTRSHKHIEPSPHDHR